MAGNVRDEYTREYEKTKESYIEIEGMREDDHSISWLWYTVGGSAGPLKTTTLNVSIRIPKDNNISQLTASIDAKLKCYQRSVIGSIGHFLIGETPTQLLGRFPFEDWVLGRLRCNQ